LYRVEEKSRGKEVLADFVKGTKKLLSRLREDMDDLSAKGRLRLEIISLKNKRARVFRDLGMRTYLLIKHGKCTVPEVAGLVEEIHVYDREIREQEQALRDYLAGGSAATPAGKQKIGAPKKGPARRLVAAGKTPRASRKGGRDATEDIDSIGQ
jgi:hypothetical protein